LETLFHRIVKESSNVDAAAFSPDVKAIQHDFFPQDSALRQWIEIGIKSRILQSNTHHQIVRGQWKVREKLLELGKGKEVFHLSVDEVTELIRSHQES